MCVNCHDFDRKVHARRPSPLKLAWTVLRAVRRYPTQVSRIYVCSVVFRGVPREKPLYQSDCRGVWSLEYPTLIQHKHYNQSLTCDTTNANHVCWLPAGLLLRRAAVAATLSLVFASISSCNI